MVGRPLDPRRQARARRQSLGILLHHLEADDVEQVWLEARSPNLNAKDLHVIGVWRAQHVISHKIRVDHAYPRAEPLLWLPDVVAGAISAAEAGHQHYRDALANVLTEHRVTLD